QIRGDQVSLWALIEAFERRLKKAAAAGKETRTFTDPRRKLEQKDYLGLLLFGLFNPVVDSMRVCARRAGCGGCEKKFAPPGVSLGSFSEAQAVVDPVLLQRVFAELAAEQQSR